MDSVDVWREFVERYRDDPVLFVQEVLGAEPYEWQRDLLKAYAGGVKRISVRSGHRVGKTACLAWVTIHHLIFRYPQKTVLTAATEKQLFNALVPEVKSWIGKMPAPVSALLDVKSETIRLSAKPDDSFLTISASRAESPEAIAGVHSEGSVLIIVDEASGVPDAIFEAGAGSMAGKTACTILAGNPVRRRGFFHQTHTRLRRSADDDKTPGLWWTRHVSSEGNPNVDPEFVEAIKAQYGETSNAFRVRVLGEFPISEDDTIISYDLILAAAEREVKQAPGPMLWGLDVAAQGDDRTCLVKRRANVVPEAPLYWRKLDPMQIAGKVKHVYDETPPQDRPEKIYVDVVVWGAGVVSRLRELGLPAHGVNVSELPSLRDAAKYRNLRTEFWFRARDWFASRDSRIPNEEDFIEELAAQPYKVVESSGRVLATPKKEVKGQLGRSPDAADAFILTFCHAGGVSSGQTGTNWNTPLKRNIKGLV